VQYVKNIELRKRMNMPMEDHKKVFYIADLGNTDDMEKIWSLIDVDCWYRKTHCFAENLLDRLLTVDNMPIFHAVIRMEQGEPGSCIFQNRDIDLIKFALEIKDKNTLRLLFPYIRSFDCYDKKQIIDLIAEVLE